jgi:CRP-like cAMP-binding protein
MASFFSFLNTITDFSEGDFIKSQLFFSARILKKRELWINQNQVCKEIAFISKGLLRSYYVDQKGNEVTSCFCVSNSMASSFKSFIAQQASDLAIQALEETELITINYQDLQYLYKAIPKWQEVSRMLMEQEYLSLWRYAYSLNRENALEKYLHLLNEQPEVVQKAPVQDIASYLGISRETLSRIRKKVKAEIM